MADSKHANDTNLDTFLDDTFAKLLNYSELNTEVQVVCQLVGEMVNNVVKEAYSPDSGLTVRQVLPVGSMAEDTRIKQPDEFDFMVVVDQFHADDITWIETGLEGTFVRLKPRCKGEKCTRLMKKPCSDKFTTASGSDCDCKSALLTEEMRTFKLIREVVYKMAEDDRSWSVTSFPGKLSVRDGSTSQSGPAVTFELKWERDRDQQEIMIISIDLAPVLELETNSFFLKQLHIFHQDFYERLRDTNKVHLVQRLQFSEDVFQVSFALTEFQIIQNESETHRKCYMLLKYIYRTREGPYPLYFSSFVFKNLFLQHAVQCDGGKLVECLLKILVDLRDKLDVERSAPLFIAHIFSTKKNLLKYGELDEESNAWWTNHRKELSEFIKDLENFKDGLPIPNSFQFLMMKNDTPSEYKMLFSYHDGPKLKCQPGLKSDKPILSKKSKPIYGKFFES